PRGTRADSRVGLVHRVLLGDVGRVLAQSGAQAGLEQDHVRHAAQRLEGRLRGGEVVEGAVTEDDVEPTEPGDVLGALEVEGCGLTCRVSPLDLGDVFGPRVGGEDLAAAVFEKTGEHPDAGTDLEHRLAVDGELQAGEVIQPGLVDRQRIGFEESPKRMCAHEDFPPDLLEHQGIISSSPFMGTCPAKPDGGAEAFEPARELTPRRGYRPAARSAPPRQKSSRARNSRALAPDIESPTEPRFGAGGDAPAGAACAPRRWAQT